MRHTSLGPTIPNSRVLVKRVSPRAWHRDCLKHLNFARLRCDLAAGPPRYRPFGRPSVKRPVRSSRWHGT